MELHGNDERRGIHLITVYFALALRLVLIPEDLKKLIWTTYKYGRLELLNLDCFGVDECDHFTSFCLIIKP